MSRIILLAILLFVAVLRLWYISYAGNSIVIKPDSKGYYMQENFFGEHMLTNFFNPNRTPGYTILTSVVIKDKPAYESQSFLEQARILIFIQTAIGLFSLLVLYDTLLALKISQRWSLVFVGLTGVNIYQFIWDRALLTESLYISLFIILMRLFVSLIKKPTAKTGVMFIVLAICGFMLRPAGLAVPYLLLPIVWCMHRTKKVFLLLTVLLCVYTAVPVTFVGMNKYLYNFTGLSFNPDFAVFGRILLFDIPVDSAASVPNLYHKVQEYRAIGGNISIPWYFFVYYGNEVYDRLSELQEFNT